MTDSLRDIEILLGRIHIIKELDYNMDRIKYVLRQKIKTNKLYQKKVKEYEQLLKIIKEQDLEKDLFS